VNYVQISKSKAKCKTKNKSM